jgi:hypothetical protein
METGQLEKGAFPPFFFWDYIETGDVLLLFSPGRFAAAKAVNLHLKCKIRQGPVIYDDAYAPFHVCWHQIRPKNYIDQPKYDGPNHWQYGPLWDNSPGRELVLEKCSFTVRSVNIKVFQSCNMLTESGCNRTLPVSRASSNLQVKQ